MKKRIVSLLMAVALIFGMIAIPGIIPDAAAAASVGTLTVDLSKDAINPNVENGEILHGTAGFLYGISNEDVPTTNTLVPLKPKILVTKGAVGTEHPYGDSLDVAKTFLESGGWQIQMYVSNYYGVFGVTATPQEFAQVLKDYICPAVVAWKKAWKEEHGTPDKPKDNIGASIDIDEAIVYVPINEGTPAKLDDGDYNDDFNQSWDIYWDAIKAVDPEASFVGPNSCSYGVQFNYNHWWTNKQATINKDGQEISVSDGMLDYFQHCADTNRLPDVVSWHELETEDLDGIHYHMEDFKNIWYYGVDWEKYFEITGATEIPKLPQVCINEYLDIWSSGVPGKMVNWMARLEDEGMTGTLAYYHQANNLDDLTAGANEGNAAWWVFQWYGNMAGTLQEVETDTHYSELYGLATMDEEKDLATAIFGGYTGTIKVDLENVTSRDAFKGAEWVNVTVEEASYLGFHGAVEETPVIVKGIYPVNADGSVTVTIDNAQAPNAYKVTVQQASEESLAEAGLILTRSNGTVYEAEAATLGGGASVYSGSRSPIYYFSGDKVVAMPTNGTLTYTIDVPADGLYRLDFVYGNGQGSNRLNRFTHNPQNITQSISLDGATAENVIMENTLYEDMAGLKTRYYNLTAGTHTIVVKTVSTVDANKVCHDFLRVSYEGVYNQARPAFNTVYEAELADFNKLITISGYPSATAAKGSSISGYSGGGYVTGLTNSVTSGAGVRFTVVVEDSGLYNLSLHYQSTASGNANIYVGNTATTLDNKVQSVSVGASSAWTDATATVYLQKGINVVDIDATADIALDYLRVRALDAQDYSTTIEAENAIPAAMTDKIEVAESTGASNGKYVVGMEGAYEDADYLEFTYNAPAAGEYEMQIFHSNNDMSDGHYQSFKIMDKYAIVEVNGESDSPDFVIVDDPNEASGTFNDVVYFVDCGDHDPSTVNTGEKLGSHNSVTDQVYGADAETGYKWGFELIDSNDVVIDAPNGPANKVVEGDKAIYTTYQYARCNEYAQVVDGLDKNQSSRYANNQDNNGINPRRITYKFEVEPKLYEVTVGMGDIWNNALNPTVTLSANGVADVSLTYQVPKYSYQVQKMQIDLTNATTNSNGMVELTVKGTSSDPTIHMNYILIADSSDDETSGDDTGDNASAESVVRLPQGVYVDATHLPDDIYIGKLTEDYMKYIDFRNLKNETDRYFFINSFSDDTFEEKTVTLTLKAGENTIRIYNDNSWNATVGGSNSTPATDELPNYTPNFDKFVITPQALSAAVEQTAEYNVSIYASEGGTAVANVNTVAANGSYTLTITADSSKNTKVYINGENFTDKVIKTASGYSLNVENVTKDQNVNVYFTVSDETLNDLIEQAEALVEEDYTSNSWEDLVEALEEAESAESESEKTTAFNELAKALDELVNKDKSVYYFVDCGDHDPSTVTGKNDDFGWNNSVTDQVYGADAETGYSWGFELIAEKNEVVIDAPNGASNKVVEGDKAIYSTYQYARCNEDYQVADGLDKNESSRYAHNQKESGISPRRVTYKFELDPGEYKVTVSMGDIWNNALNPTVTLVADGVDNVAESYSIAAYGYQEKTMSINLTNAEKNSNGKVELSVKGTSTNDTIHMNYIIIRGENVVVPDPTVPATGVTLDAANATLIVDETKQLTATVLPEGATDSTVTWKSSDLTVATVDERGLVTAVSKGTATITVTTTDGGHTATCVVTVVDKTELNELIEEAEGLEENEDDYTEESWAALEEALEAAEAVLDDPDATQEEVDAAAEALKGAIEALEDKPEEVPVDKSALEAAIEGAEALNEEDYTEESWAALEEALEDAKAIYEDENASQANVDAATETLEAAIAALEEKPSEPDYPEFPDYPLPPFRPIIPVVGGAVEEPAEFPFVDVPENAWFYDEVKQAWENDLIDGVTGTLYKPEETLTVAQAIKLAAALHQMYNNGKVTLTNGAPNWYDSYVRYAVANGIIEAKYDNYNLTQMNAPISREEFVHIFHGAMNEKAYYACNHVADNAIPDVKMNDTYASEIYTFYRAGILTGSDAQGTFNPDSSIKRSEVAAILIRMYDANARQAVTLS